ncbi:MAG: hypothetical protein ACT6FC_06400, partial [Methanosarcinaceae archaeon]
IVEFKDKPTASDFQERFVGILRFFENQVKETESVKQLFFCRRCTFRIAPFSGLHSFLQVYTKPYKYFSLQIWGYRTQF